MRRACEDGRSMERKGEKRRNKIYHNSEFNNNDNLMIGSRKKKSENCTMTAIEVPSGSSHVLCE